MSLISVITINYNDAAGLKKTMESVVSQSFRDVEYIVIDGGSTDGSVEVIKHYDRIHYWVSEKDKGIYDAMNKGIAKATGTYLLFLNSGDYLFETQTLEQISAQLHTHDILYGNLKINENGILKDGFMPDDINLSQMMTDTLWHPVSFIKRELFQTYGLYDTRYKICGDYDFFFKVIIAHKATTRHLHRFISVFDLNGISSNVNNVGLIKQEKETIQRSYLSEQEIEDFKKSRSETGFFRNLKTWFSGSRK